MKQPFYMTFWFWGLVFAGFLGIIFWGEDLEKDALSRYARQKMRLTHVKFDELEAGFENATLYADVVDMDDSQSNMTATNIHAYFFDRKIATRTGELVASWGFKTPFEARLWGDVRLHTSTRERFRGEEVRYFFSRNEIFSSMPVILWKDDMIVTGRELRYNPKTKEGSLARDVLIRIWETASQT
ncbi:LPS export ABC transporter periplasmic protein LptC, partial [Candidatus Ozemobacteraceae bacterium]|nr:LPS export ABC transporter periplasmic protein LptC [Candidatus Ozemobacteraceae bacterium]